MTDTAYNIIDEHGNIQGTFEAGSEFEAINKFIADISGYYTVEAYEDATGIEVNLTAEAL